LKKPKKLTEAEVARRLDETFHKILEENGLLLWSPDELKEMLKSVHISPNTKLARGLSIGAMIGLSSAGKKVAPLIKTEEQLDRALQAMRQQGDKIPTMMRKAAKEMTLMLPRRGGPGRQPKLTAEEKSLMCDLIASFIRQKMKLKPALAKASEQAPGMLGGKKVSARTLQKAWDERDKIPSNRRSHVS